MDKLAALPIDWANVNWPYVCSLVGLVFVCTFFGSALSLGRTVFCCVLTALLFGTAFIFWTYYPHDLPLPTLATPQKNAPSATAQPPWFVRDPAADNPSRRY
jgi:hypothetical protein